MSDYAWIIDKDDVEDGENDGLMGPWEPSSEFPALEDGDVGERFRIYDDDGVLYYSGRIIGDYCGFEPLDDFGLPNAGASEIRYYNLGARRWEVL